MEREYKYLMGLLIFVPTLIVTVAIAAAMPAARKDFDEQDETTTQSGLTTTLTILAVASALAIVVIAVLVYTTFGVRVEFYTAALPASQAAAEPALVFMFKKSHYAAARAFAQGVVVSPLFNLSQQASSPALSFMFLAATLVSVWRAALCPIGIAVSGALRAVHSAVICVDTRVAPLSETVHARAFSGSCRAARQCSRVGEARGNALRVRDSPRKPVGLMRWLAGGTISGSCS